jgi:hypothetical protein
LKQRININYYGYTLYKALGRLSFFREDRAILGSNPSVLRKAGKYIILPFQGTPLEEENLPQLIYILCF